MSVSPSSTSTPATPKGKESADNFLTGSVPAWKSSDVLPPVEDLFTLEQVNTWVTELRAQLAADEEPAVKKALEDPEVQRELQAFGGWWFQRIAFPELGWTTTSDRRWVYFDQGSINTLGLRLTSDEASLLRPYPKWKYIQPHVPPLEGKTVLEIGAANGFFTHRFAELGAKQVTGVEIVESLAKSAAWGLAKAGRTNARIVQTDFLFDMTLERHDIVFLSEVHNHLLCPFFGLLRLLNLSRELLILDGGFVDKAEQDLKLYTGWNEQTQTFVYHHFEISDGLLVNFLNLIGVRNGRIRRFREPGSPTHMMYLIDTRGVDEERKTFGYNEYLQRALEMKLIVPEGARLA